MDAWNLPAPPSRTWFGLDRRLIPGFALVVAIVLLWSTILPAINEAVEQGEIPAGTTVKMSRGVSFSPAAGWVFSGAPFPGARDIEVSESGLTFAVHVSEFNGSSRALLSRIETVQDSFKVSGPVKSFNVNGVDGSAQERYGASSKGALFTLVKDGVGVSVVVDGPAALVDASTRDVGGMVASIRFGATS